MLDLAAYRPVSQLPGMRRDLSIAVAADEDVDTLGDRVRLALGSEADLLESVTILAETAHDDLPLRPAAASACRPDRRTCWCG